MFKLTIGTFDDPQLPSIWNRFIPVNPVIFVRPQLFPLVVSFADESVDGVLIEPVGFQVSHGSLGGAKVLEVLGQIVVMSFLSLAPTLIRLHIPA